GREGRGERLEGGEEGAQGSARGGERGPGRVALRGDGAPDGGPHLAFRAGGRGPRRGELRVEAREPFAKRAELVIDPRPGLLGLRAGALELLAGMLDGRALEPVPRLLDERAQRRDIDRTDGVGHELERGAATGRERLGGPG